MRKLVCDCCGKEIDTSYMEKYSVRPSGILKIFTTKDGLEDELDYDLCLSCSDKFVTFLKNGANLNEN